MPFKSNDVFRNVISPSILRGVFEGDFSFDPATLFALGEDGAWYEAFDISTLFQDSTGTTPVTAASDPVGLMLDKSQGALAGLGSDIGDEFTGTWATQNNGASVTGGDCLLVGLGVGGNPLAEKDDLVWLSGKFYLIEFEVSSISSGAVKCAVRNNANTADLAAFDNVSATGTYSFLVVPDGTGCPFRFSGTTNSTNATVSNYTIRELPGNHALQSVSAARPTYETGPARLTMDKIDDRLVATVPAIDGTMILSTPEGTAAYGVDISAGSYDIGGRGGDYFPGTALVGQILRDGAMTQPEIDAAITYFRANGGGNNYGAVTDFTNFWRNWDEIASFPLIDTSSGTSFSNAWLGCSSLTSFPLIDTSSGTNFSNAWQDCSSLTSFPALDTSSGTNFNSAWEGCSSLTSFPALDVSSGTIFQDAWRDCSSLTSFPALDLSGGTTFLNAWRNCSSLTTFPLIDTSSGTNFSSTWNGCSSLTSFPLLDTSSGTSFSSTWNGCSSLTSFPLLDTSSGTSFSSTWNGCSSLTSFPLIDTSSGTSFANAWNGCSSLTSFPLIDTSSGTSFQETWRGCSSLTSFPLIDTSSGTNFTLAWRDCSSLTSFPALDVSGGTTFSTAWFGCSSLTTFPANMFDSVTATNFTNAFTSTALNQTSIDNILVSINTANTSNGTFTQSGGTAPSATGEAAIDALRARGWTVTVTGGY